MKGHRAFRVKGVDRKPPIELAHWGGVPGIAMRMVRVADAGGLDILRA